MKKNKKKYLKKFCFMVKKHCKEDKGVPLFAVSHNAEQLRLTFHAGVINPQGIVKACKQIIEMCLVPERN
jgi:hypothetical protein